MANLQYFDIILRPVVTEKSMADMAEKKYTFLVHPEANKVQIKEAVETWRVRPREEAWYSERQQRERKQSLHWQLSPRKSRFLALCN